MFSDVDASVNTRFARGPIIMATWRGKSCCILNAIDLRQVKPYQPSKRGLLSTLEDESGEYLNETSLRHLALMSCESNLRRRRRQVRSQIYANTIKSSILHGKKAEDLAYRI